MLDSFIELVAGNLDDKREYKRIMKRVKKLPPEYRFAFRKMQDYLYTFSAPDISLFSDIIELFEISAKDGREVSDIIGNDASQFCDDMVRAAASDMDTQRDKLNKEVREGLERLKQ